jgi:hypothetical protein
LHRRLRAWSLYDAAALTALAMEAAGSKPNGWTSSDSVMDVANAPGTEIFP